jgi:4-diphosphocytidyl-2-C-methyl-D-erythritol kinase
VISLTALAPAKVNLCLYVGPTRPDGRHELVTVMDTVSLADRLVLGPAGDGAGADEVLCPGVAGPNLAAAALRDFRARIGWDAPPVRVRIDKRIPIAGGMGGGSADAAAVLRLAAAAAGLDDPALLERVAAGLGADVPSQVRGGRVLATGMGEVLEPVDGAEPYGALVLPVDAALAAGAVYAEADRRGLVRDAISLAERRAAVRETAAAGALPAAANDLQDAARTLCPAIDAALADAVAAGADDALVSGSGPTVLGLFRGEDGAARARAAACRLGHRRPAPVAVRPVPGAHGAVAEQG